ncbi:MAG: hypothetical protein WD826_04090 [Actinomycetota bacterium]
MEINSWPGAIAVILAIISFYGMTYVVIALNVGWRFGYWLSSACFGALMVLLSIFWTINVTEEQAVGPQGATPRWIPVAAGAEVQQATFGEQTFTAPARYPTGWEQPEEEDTRVEKISSSIANCITADPSEHAEPERTACETAQSLMPKNVDIPVIDGTPVTVTPEVTEPRFTEDNGAVLAEATIVPLTKDPRVTEDPAGKPMADPFQIALVLDKGSVGLPTYMSLVIFAIYFAFHLWGLNRAEKRKLQPAVT